MSRIGKQPIVLPAGVTVTVTDGFVRVQGPKGALDYRLHPHVQAAVHENALQVRIKNVDDRKDRALWGLSRMLIANMVKGVSEGFSKALEVHGVGYRVQVQGSKIVLALGFSHPVEFELPEGIQAAVEKNVLTITGIEKQLVGETAARIRAYRKPEPYKGKGIRYVGEHVRRKSGKVVKGAQG